MEDRIFHTHQFFRNLGSVTLPYCWRTRSFARNISLIDSQTMRKEHVSHKTLRGVALTLPVRWWRSQGLQNRQNRFSALFRLRRVPDPALAAVSGFLFVDVVDGCQEVVAQACACFLTIEPFDAIDVHSRKPIFMAWPAVAHRKKIREI